jgi:hypothetical protein
MRAPQLRELTAAPELVEIVVAHVALYALETVLVLEHGVAIDAEEPLHPGTQQRAARLLDASRALRRELRAYRRYTMRLLRHPPPGLDDRLF